MNKWIGKRNRATQTNENEIAPQKIDSFSFAVRHNMCIWTCVYVSVCVSLALFSNKNIPTWLISEIKDK